MINTFTTNRYRVFVSFMSVEDHNYDLPVQFWFPPALYPFAIIPWRCREWHRVSFSLSFCGTWQKRDTARSLREGEAEWVVYRFTQVRRWPRCGSKRGRWELAPDMQDENRLCSNTRPSTRKNVPVFQLLFHRKGEVENGIREEGFSVLEEIYSTVAEVILLLDLRSVPCGHKICVA